MKLFDDTQIAFASKSDAELERAYFLFKLIANQPLVRIGTQVAQFALKSHLPVEGLIRASVFDHFCAGTTANESLKIVNKLFQKKVYSVLDYSVEGAKSEVSLDECLSNTLDTLTLSTQSDALPFSVFKPSGFGSFSLYEKKSSGQVLSDDENAAWERIRQRYIRCCQKAKDLDICILIDAEETWIQPAVNELVEEMMSMFNTEKAIVYITAQMYLSKKMDYLEELLVKAKSKGFVAGIKLVRGAYMEKEADRAKSLGYVNPICSSKAATDNNFNEALQFILNNLIHLALYMGSHNEDSTYLLIDEMKKRKIKHNHPHIWFGQLYGMSDHITFNLANSGFQVSKYLPFGPVKDVLPYLIRRAEENTSVAGQTVRELELLLKERKRRKMN